MLKKGQIYIDKENGSNHASVLLFETVKTCTVENFSMTYTKVLEIAKEHELDPVVVFVIENVCQIEHEETFDKFIQIKEYC